MSIFTENACTFIGFSCLFTAFMGALACIYHEKRVMKNEKSTQKDLENPKTGIKNSLKFDHEADKVNDILFQ